MTAVESPSRTEPLAVRVLSALDRAGGEVVLVAGRRRVTGAALAAQIRDGAAELAGAGVGPGTPVGFAGMPGADTLAALLSLRASAARSFSTPRPLRASTGHGCRPPGCS